VKDAQRERRAALGREPIDGLLDEPIAFVSEQGRFQRFMLSRDPQLIGMAQCIPLHGPAMADFVGR
jgi:hypothetical protein